ncbi:FecR domain-containing protein [uncultured Shimia sp.]|uniref:FecR domain-containing protein n=1 Tax=uncultured Shimia sp. TaxID=573152 RepID=UPI0026157D56|nr:FecR domain-containing protein [uncultured Shimia sp.]
MEVQSGDLIKTNGTGMVQLVFVDETKIVIGPNASMVLEVTMLRNREKADNFAVKALGGSFRFISGKSRKKAYKITTPTATMGIRGTTFDFWVADHKQTSVIILSGAVRMCGQARTCKSFSGDCSYMSTDSRGQVGIVEPGQDATRAVQAGFPFLLNQSDLREGFQADTASCGKYVAVAVKKTKAVVDDTTPYDPGSGASDEPEPDAPEPDAPEPDVPDKPDRPSQPAPSKP